MQIYVIGSLDGVDPFSKADAATKQKQYGEDKPKFVAACEALGYSLSKKGHQVRVGISRWEDIEDDRACFCHVICGASEAAKETLLHIRPVEVICDVPQAQPTDEAGRMWEVVRGSAKNVNLKFRPLRLTDSGVSRTQRIDEADAYILIGGGKNTERIGYSAHAMDKPVLAVTVFGRAAKAVYSDILYDAYGDAGAGGEFHTPWGDEKADANNRSLNRSRAATLVDLIQRITKRKREQDSRNVAPLAITIAACCALLVGWVTLYLFASQGSVSARIAFFSLLFITAAIGTGMRILVDFQRNATSNLRLSWLMIELAVSLMLAFGLALIYLIGGITFTGTVVTLEPNSATGERFPTIALSMSVLGLAAGFLAPVDKLRQRLERAIEERQDGTPA